MAYALGKLPARLGAIKLLFAKYVDYSRLPATPNEFGHDQPQPAWGMLANDRWGCCVWSGFAHQTMLWRKNANLAPASFGDAQVLSDYSAATGFAFSKATDSGTDMQSAAGYWRGTGILDAAGNRHRIRAYLGIGAGDIEGLLAGAHLFGSAGVGVNFPAGAMGQFDANEPWTLVIGSAILGGHYVPLVARRGGASICVSWGREQAATDPWLNQYNDEGVVCLSEEFLRGGRSLDGFDLDQLDYDLAVLEGTAQPRSQVSMSQDPKMAAAKLAAATAAATKELGSLFPQWEINLVPNLAQNMQLVVAAALTASDEVEANWPAQNPAPPAPKPGA